MNRKRITLLVIFSILIIDQLSKILVKTTMYLGQEYRVLGDWFIIHFTENNGMAFGMDLPGEFGKIALTLFRMVAAVAIAWYLSDLIKKKAPVGFIVCISMIFAGAVGNIFDSAFYGMIFNESYYNVATMFPEEGGYASFLHGRVVDMLYFPLMEGRYPDWMPVWEWLPGWFPKPNQHFIFFRPVFNIADSSITVGVFIILIFQRRFFAKL